MTWRELSVVIRGVAARRPTGRTVYDRASREHVYFVGEWPATPAELEGHSLDIPTVRSRWREWTAAAMANVTERHSR